MGGLYVLIITVFSLPNFMSVTMVSEVEFIVISEVGIDVSVAVRMPPLTVGEFFLR